MKRLAYDADPDHVARRTRDLIRISCVCAESGYRISPSDLVLVWEALEHDAPTGQLILPEDDADLLVEVLCYCQEEVP